MENFLEKNGKIIFSVIGVLILIPILILLFLPGNTNKKSEEVEAPTETVVTREERPKKAEKIEDASKKGYDSRKEAEKNLEVKKKAENKELKNSLEQDIASSFGYFKKLNGSSEIERYIPENKFDRSHYPDQQTLYSLVKLNFELNPDNISLYESGEQDTYIILFDLVNKETGKKVTYKGKYYNRANAVEITGVYGSFAQIFGGV